MWVTVKRVIVRCVVERKASMKYVIARQVMAKWVMERGVQMYE